MSGKVIEYDFSWDVLLKYFYSNVWRVCLEREEI